jgi:hypothetical protein
MLQLHHILLLYSCKNSLKFFKLFSFSPSDRNDQLYDQRVTKKFVLPLAEYVDYNYRLLSKAKFSRLDLLM